MSNIIITKFKSSQEDLIKTLAPIPAKDPIFKGDMDCVCGVWNIEQVEKDTYIMSHHCSAESKLNDANIQIEVIRSRDIDCHGVEGLPQDMLDFVLGNLVAFTP